MNTEQIIADIKQRHNLAEFKLYLKEKYANQLVFAHAGGMWRADLNFISQLSAVKHWSTLVLLDIYQNPVEIAPHELLERCERQYQQTMQAWMQEQDSAKGLR